MAIIKLTTEQKKLIEKIGVFLEKTGSTPVEGRIQALLMVSDDVELSFEDIYETLGISKSATSNTINVLLTTNKIDYITKHGDRKRYFRNRIEKWETDFGKNVNESLYMSELFKEVLAIRPKTTKEFNNSMKSLVDFMEYLKIEIPVLLKKWQDQKK
jgi:DNA-binding transcriptional regulator GbsR (MarR family)